MPLPDFGGGEVATAALPDFGPEKKLPDFGGGMPASVLLKNQAAPEPGWLHLLRKIAPPPDQLSALMAPAALQTDDISKSPIPAINEVAQIIQQLPPAKTLPGQIGQSLLGGGAGLAQGATSWNMLPALALGGPIGKLIMAGVVGQGLVKAPFEIKDVYDRPGVMSDKDKQDIANIISSGVASGWLGGKLAKSGVGGLRGRTAPAPVSTPTPELEDTVSQSRKAQAAGDVDWLLQNKFADEKDVTPPVEDKPVILTNPNLPDFEREARIRELESEMKAALGPQTMTRVRVAGRSMQGMNDERYLALLEEWQSQRERSNVGAEKPAPTDKSTPSVPLALPEKTVDALPVEPLTPESIAKGHGLTFRGVNDNAGVNLTGMPEELAAQMRASQKPQWDFTDPKGVTFYTPVGATAEEVGRRYQEKLTERKPAAEETKPTVEPEKPAAVVEPPKPASSLTGNSAKDFESLALKAATEKEGQAAFHPDETDFMDRMSDADYERWTKRYQSIRKNRRAQGLQTAEPGNEGPAWDVSKDITIPELGKGGRGDNSRPIQKRTTVELLNNLGVVPSVHPDLKKYGKAESLKKQFTAKISDVPDEELQAKWSHARTLYRTLRKRQHPDVGGDSAVAGERNAVFSELEQRFQKEFDRRNTRRKYLGEEPLRGEGLQSMPPGFEERERELRGPFQLSSVDLATDPEKMGFKDITTPLDAQQVRGRIRNKVSPTEWEMVKDTLPEKGKISPGEAAKLMQEGGPRVEVRTKGTLNKDDVGYEALVRRNAEIRHFADTNPGLIRFTNNRAELLNNPGYSITRKQEAGQMVQEFNRNLETTRTRGWTGAETLVNWSSISPKPESQMKGYVEIAVVKPSKPGASVTGVLKSNEKRDIRFPSTHSFPPNTLAFVRGYMEGDTFHVIEVQSDWAQKLRERKESQRASQEGPARTIPVMQEQRARMVRELDNPLLQHYERLALKAAIDHARKQGVKRIAVQDAESAMMTEGHDRAAKSIEPVTTEQVYDHYIRNPREVDGDVEKLVDAYGEDWEKGKYLKFMGDIYRVDDVNKNFEHRTDVETAKELQRYVDVGGNKIPQEPGMRLHYDQTLPKILSELTGDKGERVGFGEHKMAFERTTTGFADEGDPSVRKDLIFRNPDGTPKTDVTARSFDLSKVKTPFSLLGKDKPQAPTPTVEGAPPAMAAVPSAYHDELKAMGLSDGTRLHEGVNAQQVAESIKANPTVFGKRYAEMAWYLTDNFDHILPLFRVDHDDAGIGRAYADMDPGNRRIGLATNGKGMGTPVQRFMHEAGHAALQWQAQYPKTAAQRAANARLVDVMQQALEKMPEDVRKFYEDVYRPASDGMKSNAEWKPILDQMKEKGWTDEWATLFHALRNPGEFLASAWESTRGDRFREQLNSWEYKGKKAWQAIVDVIRDLFGVKQGSMLDATLSVIHDLGKEGADAPREGAYTVGDNAQSSVPMAVMERLGKEPRKVESAPPGEGTPAEERARVKDADFREKVRAKVNAFAGYSLPHLFSASKDVANAGVRYASSRIAAPLLARSLATQVLGTRYKSGEFNRVMGDVLVEDRLRAIKQGWLDQAGRETDPVKKQEALDTAADVRTLIGAEGHSLRTEAQYRRLLANPEMQAAIDRHKALIMPLAEAQQLATKGHLAAAGPDTGAFVNLMAIFAPDDVESAKSMIYGSRRGDTTNPLRRGTAFGKTARGTGEMYERSYRTMAERMIRGNYEQTALREFYDALVREKLAVEERPGVPPPRTIADKPTRKITVEIRGGGPGMTQQKNLWIRNDLYDEVRHALAVDDPLMRNSAMRMFAQAVTETQVVGATDAAYHTANMFAAIITAPGGKNIGVDLLRKVPGVNVVDAGARIMHNLVRAVKDEPEVQKELATIAEAGAGRAEVVHDTYLSKGLKAIGGEKATWLDPSKGSSRFIKLVDKAGRLSLNHMYENLVTRGLADSSVEARREFINRMGQYNERLMPRLDAWLRAANVSSFIVAGKNFNRLAFQRLVFDPGVMAEGGAGSKAWWELRLTDAVGAVMTVGLLSYIVNKSLTGTPWGRAGTPAGAIDTGRDDDHGRPIVIDPLQLTLWRRALRISGAQAAYRGASEQLGGREIAHEVMGDVVSGVMHPYEGPVVRTASLGYTGYDPSGYLMSRNPDDPVENLKAAVKNANPMLASYFRGADETKGDADKGKGGVAEVGRSLLSASGIMKKGRAPTLQQEVERKTGKKLDELSIPDKKAVVGEVQRERKERPGGNDLARRAMAQKDLHRSWGEEDALQRAVAPDVQKFLTTHDLKLPSFKEELTVGGVHIPLTKTEQTKYEALVVENYNDMIRKFMPNMPEDRADWQKQLDKRLTMARARARAKLRSGAGRKALPSFGEE